MIARERKAGQFVIIQRGGDFNERIPLTIANADADKGTITIVFQAARYMEVEIDRDGTACLTLVPGKMETVKLTD